MIRPSLFLQAKGKLIKNGRKVYPSGSISNYLEYWLRRRLVLGVGVSGGPPGPPEFDTMD